jgi:hypothetical protein
VETLPQPRREQALLLRVNSYISEFCWLDLLVVRSCCLRDVLAAAERIKSAKLRLFATKKEAHQHQAAVFVGGVASLSVSRASSMFASARSSSFWCLVIRRISAQV